MARTPTWDETEDLSVPTWDSTTEFKITAPKPPANARDAYKQSYSAFVSGDRDTALKMAQESLRLDPGMTEAQRLIERFQRNPTAGTAPMRTEEPANPVEPKKGGIADAAKLSTRAVLRALPPIPTTFSEAANVVSAPINPKQIGKISGVGILPESAKEALGGEVGRAAKGFASGVGGMVEGAGGATRWLTGEKAGQGLSEYGKKMRDFYSVPDPKFRDAVYSGFGSMATFFIPGMGVSKGVQALSFAPKLATWLGVGVSSAMEALVESGSNYERGLEKFKDTKEASGAATKTFWLNLPTLVFTNKAGIFGDKGPEILKWLKSASGEAVQEWTQQVFGNMAVKDPTFEGAATAGAVGFLTGGGVKSVESLSEMLSGQNVAGVDKIQERAYPLSDELARVIEGSASGPVPGGVVQPSAGTLGGDVVSPGLAPDLAPGVVAPLQSGAETEAAVPSTRQELVLPPAESVPDVRPPAPAGSAEVLPPPAQPALTEIPSPQLVGFVTPAELKRYPVADRRAINDIAQSLPKTYLEQFALKRNEYSLWQELISNGVAPNADEMGEYSMLPLHMKRSAANGGTPVDIIRQRIMEEDQFAPLREQIRGGNKNDIYAALRELKAPERPSSNPDDYLDEAAQIHAANKAYSEENDAIDPPAWNETKSLDDPIPFEERATYGARETGELFGDRDLIVQHNVTAENIIHAVKLGGFPVPSLAITKKNQGITGFGDITLIGPKEMADPRGYARPKVFGSDVYSPRYPTIHKKVTDAAISKLKNLVPAGRKELGEWYVDYDSLQTDGERYLRGEPSVQVEFARRNGVQFESFKDAQGRPDKHQTGFAAIQAIRAAGLEDAFNKYAQGLFESLGLEDRIFKGYTDAGNRRYAPHTLENVVRILKKDIRGGESKSNIYGPGQLRARVTPQFRNVEQIRKAKGKLVTREAFQKLKSEVEGQLIEISNSLKSYYKHNANDFGFTDTVMAVMEEAPRIGLDRALKEYGFVEVPEDKKNDIREYMGRLANLPTEYFEAKILRGVGLNEFIGAVVPEGTNQEVVSLLEKHGIEIVTYKKGDDAERKNAVEALASRLGDSALFERRGDYAGQPELPFGGIIKGEGGGSGAQTKEGLLPGEAGANQNRIYQKAPLQAKYEKTGSIIFPFEKITSPADVAFAFRSLKNQEVEHLFIVATKNRKPIAVNLHSLGNINQSAYYPRSLSTFLTRVGADGFYFVHNHPSGDPTPSLDDFRVASVMKDAMEAFNIKFHGAVVINDTQFGYFSDTQPRKIIDYPGTEEMGEGQLTVDILHPYLEWSGKKKTGPGKEDLVNSPESAFAMVKGIQIDDGSVVATFVNTKNRVMGVVGMPYSPRGIVQMGGEMGGASVVLAFGRDVPKYEVSQLAAIMRRAGMDLLDVIVVNKNVNSMGWMSHRNSGTLSAHENKPAYVREDKNNVYLGEGGYIPLDNLTTLQKAYRKYLTTERGVGQFIDRANEDRIGRIMETVFDAPLTGKELKRYFKENPSPLLRQAVFEALTGDRSMEDLPQEIRSTVKRMRSDVDALSKLVAENAAPNDALKAVIERNMGKYLGRYYRLFETKNWRPSDEVIAKAKAKLRELHPRTLGQLTEDQISGVIEKILSNGSASFYRGDRRLDIPQNHFLKRKDIPKEIRDLYGEIADPVWAYLKTMSDMATIAHNAQFLKKISMVENAFKAVPDKTHFFQVPDTARWGAIRGKFTTDEIYSFLKDSIEPASGGLARFVERAVVDPFKWTKTVASLPSHPRNFLGNAMFSILGNNAITNPVNIPYYWQALKIINGREGKYRQVWKEVVRARIADTQYWGSEMPRLMEEMLADPAGWPDKIINTLKWPVEKLGQLYNNEDLVYRIAAFLKYRENGMTVEEAAQEVDKWFTNYARLPQAIKIARRWAVFGPFLSFKANTVRILINSVKASAEGLSKGDVGPSLRLAFVLSFISALAAGMAKIFDVDDEDMKKLQELGPVYRRRSTPTYYRDGNGKIKAFDIGYIWPAGEFQKAGNAVLAGDAEAFIDSIDLFQHPIFSVYSVLFDNYDTHNRRSVSNKNDPLPRQAADKMAKIAEQIYVPASSPIPSIPGLREGRVEPGLLTGYQIKTLYDALHGVQDIYGRTRSFPEELKNFATGVRTWTIYPEDIITSYKRRKVGELFEAKQEARRYLRMPSITKEERERRLADLKRRIDKITSDIKSADAIKVDK